MLSLIKEQSGSILFQSAPNFFLYSQIDITGFVLWIIIFIGIAILLFQGGGVMSRNVPINNESLLNKLFRWKKQVEYNGVTFYVRIVGDAVIEDARKYALMESRKFRKKLHDQNSDEYFLFLDPFNDFTDDELNASAQISASRQIMEDYLRNNPKPIMESLGDNPSQEQIEQYEEAKEQRDEDYIKGMQQYVEDWRKNFEDNLSKQSHDALIKLVQRYEIENRCGAVYTDAFETYVVAASVYKDPQYKDRMFTVDDYKSLPTEVKRLLYDTYNTINISTEDLKN